MRSKLLVGGCLIALLAVAAFAQTRTRGPGGGAELYRVTGWPDRTNPSRPYARDVQEHLNRMAAEGWRFHSDIVGQFGKMMVFERADRP